MKICLSTRPSRQGVGSKAAGKLAVVSETAHARGWGYSQARLVRFARAGKASWPTQESVQL
eukprot:scaffold24529_cov140-Isochrysis_galbana.AAC.7